jgi:NAD(P)-dependent dehydrogenase (short-subunit alcohol dehydrogenase family)
MGYLDGRVALITGAGRGIGAALAQALAGEGARVVVNDFGVGLDGSEPDTGPAHEVVDTIVSAGGEAVANTGDVADFASAREMVTQAIETFGRLDVLINAAGVLRDRMIFNMDEDEWDTVIRVHMKGTFATTRHAAAYWRENRGGPYRLINVTSTAGLYGSPGMPNYSAAKMGIVGFTLSCANALRRYGVTSNAIMPRADTRMVASMPDDKAATAGVKKGSPERAPENVAPAVLYLAGPDSDWINGRVIGVGGYRIALYANCEVEREVMIPEAWERATVFAEIEGALKETMYWTNPFAALG